MAAPANWYGINRLHWWQGQIVTFELRPRTTSLSSTSLHMRLGTTTCFFWSGKAFPRLVPAVTIYKHQSGEIILLHNLNSLYFCWRTRTCHPNTLFKFLIHVPEFRTWHLYITHVGTFTAHCYFHLSTGSGFGVTTILCFLPIPPTWKGKGHGQC